MAVTEDLLGREHHDEAPATVGRLVASEAAAVSELVPAAAPELEAVVSDELDAFAGLAPDCTVEVEANLRVLLAEHDDLAVEPAEARRVAEAADAVRALAPDADLVEG